MSEPGMRETVWRRGWKDAIKGWQDWRFIVLDVLLLPMVGLLIHPVAIVAAAGASLLCVWLIATTTAPIRQRNEARQEWQALLNGLLDQMRNQKSPEDRAVEMLQAISFGWGSATYPAGKILLFVANLLRVGLERNEMARLIEKMEGSEVKNAVAQADSIVQAWVELGIVDVIELQRGYQMVAAYKLSTPFGATVCRLLREAGVKPQPSRGLENSTAI